MGGHRLEQRLSTLEAVVTRDINRATLTPEDGSVPKTWLVPLVGLGLIFFGALTSLWLQYRGFSKRHCL
eukprot:NODE_10797_length_276_cov_29.585903_g9027_i0.p2 GENE.NODE_10797_length_276_cov_29.585903_g9027_i0~~NODE_10797_length_276_cov_29.585903_g9027_i0.p2  ORF type:complete len:79 (+),score=34.76 NODE_10797_length_276_cov_29.585903_g9027_i0:32-238(+)